MEGQCRVARAPLALTGVSNPILGMTSPQNGNV